MKICIDAGHYGKYNRSPALPEYYESDMNWKLHLLLKKELETYGFQVITTRSDKDKDLDLVARGRASKGCKLLISLHSNASGSQVDDTTDYPLACVQVSGIADKLGKALADKVAKVMGTKQPGRIWANKTATGKDYYGVLRGAAQVGTLGIILEHSFHTNTCSTKWLLDDANLAKLAKAEAEVIADYFGVEKNISKGAVDVKVSVLKKGAKGASVKALQILLIGNGFSCGSYGADGSFGVATDKAVRAYQSAMGLAVDGSVGPATWSKLLGV